MPVYKVPIVHKFGIISHSQRLELQKNILEQAQKKSKALEKPHKVVSNPFQISEEFVHKYNVASLEEKEKLQIKAEQFLCRAKRRCGLQTAGEGDHVDMPLAWSELAILAQCKGKLQEDCLDVLCVSLNEAPLNDANIPTLFFLAESALYWLHTDVMKQQYLRSTEVKLLKMGQLVFLRLLFHHLCGNLRGMADLKVRLSSYLDAIRKQKSIYQSYPAVLLCFEVVVCAGDIVIGSYADSNQIAGHISDRVETAPSLAACVYRSLIVWEKVVGGKVGLKKSIESLMEAVPEISSSREWMHGYIALSLLGEASKSNLEVCRAFQKIACCKNLSSALRCSSPLSQFQSVSPRLATHVEQPSSVQQSDRSVDSRLYDSERQGMASHLSQATVQRSVPQSSVSGTGTHHVSTSHSTQLHTEELDTTQPDYVPGIAGWDWKNAYQYCHLLTDICLLGSNSDIQKTALMGKWGDADVTTFRAGVANPCVESSGLADLLEYNEAQKNFKSLTSIKDSDWTWMVRYSALSGLNKLAHTLGGSKEKAGFRSAAWSLITAIQESASTDQRVLEAIRFSELEYSRSSSNQQIPASIWLRIAQKLSEVYLPSKLDRALSSMSQVSQKSPRLRNTPKPTTSRHAPSIKRPTIGEELLIRTAVTKGANEYNTRTSLDLQRLLADQWRKDMLRKQQGDEEEYAKKLDQERKDEDTEERRILEKRREKLKGRATAMLGPYQIADTVK